MGVGDRDYLALEVSDRLVVLFHGAIAAEIAREDFRAETVGPFMVGMEARSDAA